MSNEVSIRTFGETLSVMESGQLMQDLTDLQKQIIETLQNELLDVGGKPKASLTLTIDYKLDQGVFDIVAKAKSKLPDTKRGRTLLWATPDNNFSRNNPRQPSMFGDVNEESRTVKNV